MGVRSPEPDPHLRWGVLQFLNRLVSKDNDTRVEHPSHVDSARGHQGTDQYDGERRDARCSLKDGRRFPCVRALVHAPLSGRSRSPETRAPNATTTYGVTSAALSTSARLFQKSIFPSYPLPFANSRRKLLGHTQVQTTARYAHLARDTVKASAARIGDSIDQDLDAVAG